MSFLNRKQKQQESIEEFSKALNQLASQCNFNDCCRDRLIRDVFLSGLRFSQLIRTLVTDCENKTFHECIERAKVIEQVTLDVEDILKITSASVVEKLAIILPKIALHLR